jgi:hypothetical protein
MRYLSRPIDDAGNELDAESVYSVCVDAVQKADLRAKMSGIRSQVTQASAIYWFLAMQNLYVYQPHDTVGSVSKAEMGQMFERLRRSKYGKPLYHKIRNLPQPNKCAYCDIGVVQSLDHYLPKSEFPIFSVTPLNLVASCSWCQENKKSYYSDTYEGQVLHPYFDDLDEEVWLHAEVVEGAPLAFRFFVSPPLNWTQQLNTRLETFLDELKLDILFSISAAGQAASIRYRLNDLHLDGGCEAVRAHLTEDIPSFEADHLNSWISAMYRAAIVSDWYCDGGFNQI